MSVSLVSDSAIVTGASSVTTAGINTSGASFLAAIVETYITLPSGFSDSFSNTWTSIGYSGGYGNNQNAYLYYCFPSGSQVGSGHTITASGAQMSAMLAAFSGVASVDSGITNYSSSGTSVSSLQTGSITPSVNGCLLLTHVNVGGSANPSTIDSSFTILRSIAGSGNNYLGTGFAWLVQASAAAINPTWTFTSSNTAQAVIASFKPSGGGGGQPLFRQNNLTGLGSGGPFFQNPLTRSMLGWRKALSGLLIPDRTLVPA